MRTADRRLSKTKDAKVRALIRVSGRRPGDRPTWSTYLVTVEWRQPIGRCVQFTRRRRHDVAAAAAASTPTRPRELLVIRPSVADTEYAFVLWSASSYNTHLDTAADAADTRSPALRPSPAAPVIDPIFLSIVFDAHVGCASACTAGAPRPHRLVS